MKVPERHRIHQSLRRRLVTSLAATLLIMGVTAGVATSSGIVRKAEYTEVRSGLPFAWLISVNTTPITDLAKRESYVRCRLLIALLDSCIWFVLLFVVLTGIAYCRARTQRNPNRCYRCDYPLIGLPGSRCPECGTPFHPADVGGSGDDSTSES
jgi:hypothetical protein